MGVLEVGLGLEDLTYKFWPEIKKWSDLTEHHKYKSETPGKEHLNSGATLTLK